MRGRAGAQRLLGTCALAGCALAALLTACGPGGERAEPPPPTLDTSPPPTEEAATTTSAGTPSPTTAGTRPRRPTRPLPGPVVPSTPLAGNVREWHADLSEMSAASCRRIVVRAAATTGETDLDRGLIALYRGAGEGCLGRTADARTRLTEARRLLSGLAPSALDEVSPRCRPFELLSWAFFTFLDTDIPATCPRPAGTTSSTSTTRPRSTTTSTARR